MRVLFLSAWFPYPPDNGSRIRAYNLIKALSKRHDVFLVSLLQEDSRRENAGCLEDICSVVSMHESRWFEPGSFRSLAGLFSAKPRSQLDTFDHKTMLAVREAIGRIKPDVIVASTLGVVEYVPRECRIVTVLEEHNCEFAVIRRKAERVPHGLRRLRADLGWKKFARYESEICRRFDRVVMVSESDRDQIMAASPGLRDVAVVPNGVDTDHYQLREGRPETSTLIYNGALTYDANLDAVRHFALEVWPLLSRMCPDARLRVTGRTAGVDLSGIEGCSGIELTGYVDDIRDVLHSSAVCVVPLREGGGSRLKILEAMACGVPVVSTSVGAEGIDAKNDRHLLIADDPESFAGAIQRIIVDHELAASLSREGRRLVEEGYSWSALGGQFVEIVESVARAEEKGSCVGR